MAKREKKVWSSHAEVAHIWAQQNHAEGKAGNMYFEGAGIYSYGPHYLAARIHTKYAQPFALVRSDTYSVSTSKHLSEIRSSLHGLMPYFCAPDVLNPRQAVKYLDAQVISEISESLKKLKITDHQAIHWRMDRIQDAVVEANKLRGILGMAEKHPKPNDLKAVKLHLQARLKRYKELNTPEMIAKKKAKSEAARIKREEIARKTFDEKMALWKSGENVHLGHHSSPFEHIRIKGDVVETSKGARVPLTEALELLGRLLSKKKVKTAKIGHYQFDRTEKLDDGETVVAIGCHRILLSEAVGVLGGVA